MVDHIRVWALALGMAGAAAAQDSRPGAGVSQAPRRWACTSSPEQLPGGDPSKGEIRVPGTAPGWEAFHIYTTDTWRLHCVGADFITGYYGSPQAVVLDEKGRCVLLQLDSGKWSAQVVVEDGRACSAWANGDLDPRVDGTELYVGGGGGNLYQVVHHRTTGYVTTLVAAMPGAALSKLVLADLVPARPGHEMLAFTNNGPVYEVRPDGKDRGFKFELIGDLGTRARDAVLLPASRTRPPRMAVVLQTGEVALVTRTEQGMERTALCREPMSIARIARKPPARRSGAGAAGGEDGAEVVYVARCDGLVLRFAERPDGAWTRDILFAGPQGPRGLCAGRFDADPRVETVAVFGYSKKVQLLSARPGEPWRMETLFTDVGGGHWLAAVELDGRNTTDEMIGGGFSYHVFTLGRAPGYGLADVPTDPEGTPPPAPLPEPPGTASPQDPAAAVPPRIR